MSDYTVKFEDDIWWVMDGGFKFDNFNTQEEAEHEVHLLNTMMEIEERMYAMAKEYTKEELEYFIRCFNLYGIKDIWRSLLE